MGGSITPTTPRSASKGSHSFQKSPSISTKRKSPRIADSAMSIKQARRSFIKHLEVWSLNRRATCNFSGKISPTSPAPYSKKPYALGEAVICELLPDFASTPAITIVVRLFAHHSQFKYHMMIRCGSGWEDERTWFLRQYQKQQMRQSNNLSRYSPVVSRPSPESFPITVRPLFNKFALLPIELQQRIFEYAMGKPDEIAPELRPAGRGRTHSYSVLALPLTTVMTLCRPITYHITPWFYRTTTFHFGTQHLTNFLHRIGPENRRELRKLSFSFGPPALLHVMRFFTPDQVFALFEPRLSAQQHFWRLQLQQNMREVNLAALTIKLDRMIKRDISAVEKSLISCFGSVDRVGFEKEGKVIDAVKVKGKKQAEKTWYQHTQDIFERYCQGRESGMIFGKTQLNGTVHDLEKQMEEDLEFFHT